MALLLLCCCCCCCRFCCRRKKVDDDKESDEGDGEETVDLESVELIKMPQHERLEAGNDEMDYSVAGFFEEEEFSGTVLGMVSNFFSMSTISAKSPWNIHSLKHFS